MKIIPAIDIIDGKCVRLTEGDYSTSKVYNTNPLEVAKEFEDAGIQYLHVVDLDGAKNGAIVNWKVLESICSKTALTVDFGGGLKSDKDLEIAFNSGASKITGGSIAVKNPELFISWINQYKERIILGADVRNEMIAVSGWLEDSGIKLNDHLKKYSEHGIREVICTDISRDGKLQGPNIELYKKLIVEFPSLEFIASGGISGMKDIEDCAEAGLNGTIIGKAIYEGKITMSELKKFILHVS